MMLDGLAAAKKKTMHQKTMLQCIQSPFLSKVWLNWAESGIIITLFLHQVCSNTLQAWALMNTSRAHSVKLSNWLFYHKIRHLHWPASIWYLAFDLRIHESIVWPSVCLILYLCVFLFFVILITTLGKTTVTFFVPSVCMQLHLK